MAFKDSFSWAFEQLVSRSLGAAPTMGWTAGVSIGGEEVVRIGSGWARAPSDAMPRRTTRDEPLHIASASKPVTMLGVLKLLDLWNQAVNLPAAQEIEALAAQLGMPPSFVTLARSVGAVSVKSKLVELLAADVATFTLGNQVELVTVEHLLEQRSGLRVESVTSNQPAVAFLRALLEADVVDAPGVRSAYHNNNYVLLRILVERTSSLSFSTFMQRHVFSVAGVTGFRTASSSPTEALYYTLTGWSRAPEGPTSGANWDAWANGLGALGWFVPAADLARVVDPANVRRILTVANSALVEGGLGMDDLVTPAGLATRGHNGVWDWGTAGPFGGCRAEVRVWRDSELSAAIVTNFAPADPRGALVAALDGLLPRRDDAPVEVAPTSGCTIVRVTSPVGGEWIRWTDDGTLPSATSRAVLGPLAFRSDTTVTAVLHDGVKPVLAPVRFSVTASAPLRAPAVGDGPALERGIRWERRDGAFARAALVDYAVTDAAARADRVAIPDGVPASNYGLRFIGYFAAEVDGVYVFEAYSDDGSRIEVGGVVVVDNDGTHTKRSRWGAIALQKGCHLLEVRYLQRGGSATLEARWCRSGEALRALDSDVLRLA